MSSRDSLSAVLIKPGKLEFRRLQAPRPRRGEVLLQVRAALTCGTDLKAYRHGHHLIPMPGRLGHEFSGVVEKVGPGVEKFKVGDAVAAVHSAPCLKCRYCRLKAYNLCEKIMKTKVLGAFSERLILPAQVVKLNAFKKPRGMSFEEAAFLEPLSCVVHSVEPLGVMKGQRALVLGAGPIGLLHLLLLRQKGLDVAVSDPNAHRLRMAGRLGASGLYRPERIKAGRPGFDYVFECTGRPEAWQAAVDYPRKGGTVVFFGGCREGTSVKFDAHRIHYGELTLRGSFHFSPSDVKEAFRLLCSGALGVKELISARMPLRELPKALNLLIEGRGMKYAIIP